MASIPNSQNIFTLLKQRQYSMRISNDSLLEPRIKHNMQNNNVSQHQFMTIENPISAAIETLDVCVHFVAIGIFNWPAQSNSFSLVQLWDTRTNECKWTWKGPDDARIDTLKIILDKTITSKRGQEQSGCVVCGGGSPLAIKPNDYISIIDLQEGTTKTTINQLGLDGYHMTIFKDKIFARLLKYPTQARGLDSIGNVVQWNLAGERSQQLLPDCHLDHPANIPWPPSNGPWLIYRLLGSAHVACYNTEDGRFRQISMQKGEKGTREYSFVTSFSIHQNTLTLAHSPPEKPPRAAFPSITCDVIDLEQPDGSPHTYKFPTRTHMEAPFVVANDKWICLILRPWKRQDHTKLTLQAIHRLTKKRITIDTGLPAWLPKLRFSLLYESILMFGGYSSITPRFWDLHSGKELYRLLLPTLFTKKIVYTEGEAFVVQEAEVVRLDFLSRPVPNDPSTTQALTKKRPREDGDQPE